MTSTLFGQRLLVRPLLVALVVSAFGLPGVVGAQAPADTTRRATPSGDLPLLPTRPLKFSTDEGT